jgi:glycosyltransferase involved in cell wall biosynthesis
MQHGVACISTKEGGIPGIIQDGVTGLMCQRQNAADLADKIASLIDNPALAYRMGQQDRVAFENQFTIAKFEQNLTKIFNELSAHERQEIA